MTTILVADDEFDLLETVSSILEAEGYDVVTCDSGDHALEQMKRAAPSLVLLDIMMPRLDGLETLRRIRAETSWDAVPVLLMSAIRPTLPAHTPRFEAFLKKPFSLSELLDAVARMLDPGAHERSA